MDLRKVIDQLKKQRELINQSIALLKKLHELPLVTKPVQKRGRKFMSESDRQEVSHRLKRYWAKRRADQAGAKE